VSRAGAGALAATLFGCAGAAGPVAGIDTTIREAPLAAPVGARWIEAGGATLVGPKIAGGVLVLVGGRRVLVTPGGARAETSPSPEPLQEVALVPVGDHLELVARGAHTLFRLPDPLGAPVAIARSASALRRLGVAPGVAVVWALREEAPRYVDVATGAEAAPAWLPVPYARAMQFVDARRGAAIFAGSGLAVTIDGGATFRLAKGVDALGVTEITRDGAALRASKFEEGGDAEIDVDAATLPKSSARAASSSEAPLVRWVRRTGRDPLELAVDAGVPMPWGLVVAANGMVARLDPATGLPVEVATFGAPAWPGACATARAGDAALAACSLEKPDETFFAPLGLVRVTFDGARVVVDKPRVMRNGDAELRSSPSGGLLFMRSCGAEDKEDVACAKQPDGKWLTVKSADDDELDLEGRGAGPLADGRVAFLRGVRAADDPEPRDEDGHEATGPRVVALGPDGRERTLVKLTLGPKDEHVEVQSPVQEDVDHALHFVLAGADGPVVYIGAPGGDAPRAQRVAGAFLARLAGDHGVAVAERGVLVTSDGGASWVDAGAPPSVLDFAWLRANARALEPMDVVRVGAAGAHVGSALRLGWGPPAEAMAGRADAPRDARVDAARAPALADRALSFGAPARWLACTSRGASSAHAPPALAADVPAALARPAPSKDAPHRDVSASRGARFGVLDAAAVLEVDAARAPADASTWTLRWLDPLSVGDAPHGVTLPAPRKGPMTARVAFTSARGADALFKIVAYDQTKGEEITYVVHAHGGGRPAVAEVKPDLAPVDGNEVVFGGARAAAVSWLKRSALVVWRAGEAPRVAAEVAVTALRYLADEPGKDGVVLVLDDVSGSLSRFVPFGAPGVAAAPVPIDGWTRSPPLAASATHAPACERGASGPRVWLPLQSVHASIDGASEPASVTAYELRLRAGGVCVAAVAERLVPPLPSSASSGAPPPKKKATTGPVTFVRADLEAKRAEGGDLGVAKDAAVRGMTCALEERRP
jgi:hypothetical protein